MSYFVQDEMKGVQIKIINIVGIEFNFIPSERFTH